MSGIALYLMIGGVIIILYCLIRFWLLPKLTPDIAGKMMLGKHYEDARAHSKSFAEARRKALSAKNAEIDRRRSVETGVPIEVFEACRKEYPTHRLDKVRLIGSHGSAREYLIEGYLGGGIGPGGVEGDTYDHFSFVYHLDDSKT